MLNIVMFSTSTCVHCKPVKKLLEAQENLDISYVVIDRDVKGYELAAEWGVKGVPTLLYIKDGELLQTSVGSITQEQFNGIIGDLQSDVLSEPPGGSDEGSGPVLCCPGEPQN